MRTETHTSVGRRCRRTAPLAGVLVLAGLLACAPAVGTSPAPRAASLPAAAVGPVAAASRAPNALAQVQALIGTGDCRSDADCQTIGVGHRACGGPTRYLAWSSWRTSGHALEQAAARTRVPAPADRDGPNMSTCQVLADPGAQCLPVGATAAAPGRCTLRRALPAIR